jgi:hypothetical protein
MRSTTFALLAGILAFLMAACEQPNPVGPGELASSDALIAALQQQGATVSRGEALPQGSTPYFSTNAQVIFVNAGSLNVFEYSTVAAAEGDASKVSPDGSSIGATAVTWIGPPHFYRNGRLIVLYAGSTEAVLTPLEAVLGKPFAHR